mmetsp:Transcript_52882/g.78832  ORF Transcript_52882/g.78832 Transcript_52882/m.78832 type:complete len:175 (-) Transcript_52882:351-875(-)
MNTSSCLVSLIIYLTVIVAEGASVGVSRKLRSHLVHTCFDCESSNPCAPSLHTTDVYYYSHCNSTNMFVQCSAHGGCFDLSCPVGNGAVLVWNSANQTCEYPPEGEEEQAPLCFGCGENENNPCNPLDTDNKFYYSHCDTSMYVQCSVHGDCWDRQCSSGTQWDDATLACVNTH